MTVTTYATHNELIQVYNTTLILIRIIIIIINLTSLQTVVETVVSSKTFLTFSTDPVLSAANNCSITIIISVYLLESPVN